jgi:hypothetical protein
LKRGVVVVTDDDTGPRLERGRHDWREGSSCCIEESKCSSDRERVLCARAKILCSGGNIAAVG